MDMRKCLSTIWLLLAGIVLLTACSGDEPAGTPSKELLSVQTSLAIESSSTSAAVPVEANCRWKVTLDSGWEGLSIETKEGKGNGNINILTGGQNESITPRSAVIVVESNSGVISRRIEISQLGGDIILQVSESEIVIDADGSEDKVIHVTSNADWTVVSSDEQLVTPDVPGGSQKGSVRLLVKENLSGDAREATLTFTAGSAVARSVRVLQRGRILTLSVLPATVTVGANGDTRVLEVKSNTDWTVSSSDPQHFDCDLMQGNGDQSLKLTVAENMREDARTALITIMANDTLVQQVRVNQDGKVVSLHVPQTHVQAQAIGGTYSLPVECNAEWTVTSDAFWLQVPSAAVEGSGYVTMECMQNAANEGRSAQLTIVAGSKWQVITVEQLPGMLPTASAAAVSAIGKYDATVAFSYQSATSAVSEYGVCFATHAQPTINDQKESRQVEGVQTVGSVQLKLSQLESGTQYYARPYVVNATGIAYGDEASFTTAGLEPSENDNPQPQLGRRK